MFGTEQVLMVCYNSAKRGDDLNPSLKVTISYLSFPHFWNCLIESWFVLAAQDFFTALSCSINTVSSNMRSLLGILNLAQDSSQPAKDLFSSASPLWNLYKIAHSTDFPEGCQQPIQCFTFFKWTQHLVHPFHSCNGLLHMWFESFGTSTRKYSIILISHIMRSCYDLLDSSVV